MIHQHSTDGALIAYLDGITGEIIINVFLLWWYFVWLILFKKETRKNKNRYKKKAEA